VDRFGNLVTNIDRRTFEHFAGADAIVIQVAGREVTRVVSTYADAPSGVPCALFGSSDHLEIALNGASAAALVAAGAGTLVRVGRRA
jgi:S-adenosylmethionine hydrolase